MVEVDARGRSCPEPVIMTKRTLKDNDEADILVDNRAALENVQRFGRAMKKTVSVREEGSAWRIEIRR